MKIQGTFSRNNNLELLCLLEAHHIKNLQLKKTKVAESKQINIVELEFAKCTRCNISQLITKLGLECKPTQWNYVCEDCLGEIKEYHLPPSSRGPLEREE